MKDQQKGKIFPQLPAKTKMSKIGPSEMASPLKMACPLKMARPLGMALPLEMTRPLEMACLLEDDPLGDGLLTGFKGIGRQRSCATTLSLGSLAPFEKLEPVT